MGESFAVRRFPTLPTEYRFHVSNRVRNSHVGYIKLSSWAATASTCVLKSRVEPGARTICAQSQSQKRLSPVTSTKVVSDSTLIVKSAGEEIDIQPDSSGGDGFRIGGGGGGGGGGGDKNDSGHGEGESEESDDCSSDNNKKMAMTMSQKLTLGYAALIGVGGVLGYLKSGSQKSLMAGGLSTLLLCFVYTQLPTRPVFASSVGLGLSAALLGVMGSRFKNSGKIFPAGVVSLVSFVMSGGYLHGIFRSMH